MTGCSVAGCSSHSRNGFRMIRFPANEEKRKKWAEKCKGKGWEPKEHHRICSIHFDESQFEQFGGKTKLRQDAIPTLFNSPDQTPFVLANNNEILTAVEETVRPVPNALFIERENKMHNILPNGYETIITDFELAGDPTAFSCVLRLPIFEKEDAIQWLKEFEKKSNTGWRVDRTYKESTDKIIFKKEYHCEHNTRPRSGSTPREKHTRCPSKLTITINQCMKRSKDLYNSSHPCQVRLRFIHNHDFSASTASKKRKPAESVDEWIKDMFNEITDDDQKNIASCQEQLKLVFEDMNRKLSENPSLYAEPLNNFIRLYNNCQTDSALVSALCNFGKYNEKLLIENGKKLEVQRRIEAESKTVSSKRKFMNNKLNNTNEHSNSVQKRKLVSILKKYRPIQKKSVTTQPVLILLKSNSCET